MIFKNKIKKRYIEAICYIMSLLPIFLPWCYFEEEMDGIKYGTDIVNHFVIIVLMGVTFFSILFVKNGKRKMSISVLLLLHTVIYLFYGLFWYVPLITDFNFMLSLESVHYGFYVSLLCNGLMYLLILTERELP